VPASTNPLVRQSARESVYERLLAWITDGTLAPGETIKDVEIAERLGVSRTPVREALQMLEQLGAIETRPGKSTRVAEALPGDVLDVYRPLGVLHALAAELATPNIRTEDLGRMETANESLREAIENEDPLGARQADEEFHEGIVAAAQNRFLSEVINWLTTHGRRLEALYFSQQSPAHASHEEHQEIIDALREHDAKRAAELTGHQWRRAAFVLADLVKDSGDSSGEAR
jgi:DNA-binding GntR family transcriptional regulator